jgi:ankyrin repeat protein
VELLRGKGRGVGFRKVNAVDFSGWTALHVACATGHTEVVRELLEGAGREAGFVAITNKDEHGQTALHRAWNEEIVELLLAAASRIGAEERHDLVHAVTNLEALTAMHMAAPRGLLKFCSEAELDFLLQTKNAEGHNPLHCAAYSHYTEDLRSLLGGVRERGWREQEEWRNSLDDAGLTALHIAIAFPCHYKEDDEEAVRALLCPLDEEEGGGRARGQKRKQHPDEQEGEGEGEQEDEEEERRRKERMYIGGLDPNKKCGKRTGPCRLLEMVRRNEEERRGRR